MDHLLSLKSLLNLSQHCLCLFISCFWAWILCELSSPMRDQATPFTLEDEVPTTRAHPYRCDAYISYYLLNLFMSYRVIMRGSTFLCAWISNFSSTIRKDYVFELFWWLLKINRGYLRANSELFSPTVHILCSH